eukprot:g8700.t1
MLTGFMIVCWLNLSKKSAMEEIQNHGLHHKFRVQTQNHFKSEINAPKRLALAPEDEAEYGYLHRVYEGCGELCVLGGGEMTAGPLFKHRTVSVNCPAIFSTSVYLDRGHNQATAPHSFPSSLESDYTMGGKIGIEKYYFDERYVGGSQGHWSLQLVNNMISEARAGLLKGTYGVEETNALRDALLNHSPGLKNGRVLVIGSEIPWVEACALEAGAREVVTLEYASINSTHPKVRTMKPNEFRTAYHAGTLGTFDAVVTFSSVEHSGLGRYGDALNPWADVLEIARSWCVTKTGGSLIIAVMYAPAGDRLQYNAHRLYGPLRYPYLVSNWKQVYRGTGNQRVHVFERAGA